MANSYPLQKNNFFSRKASDFRSMPLRKFAANSNFRMPPMPPVAPAAVGRAALLRGATAVLGRAVPWIAAATVVYEIGKFVYGNIVINNPNGAPIPIGGGFTHYGNCPPPPAKTRWGWGWNGYGITFCVSMDGGILKSIPDVAIPEYQTSVHIGGYYSAIGSDYSTRRFWTEHKYTRPRHQPNPTWANGKTLLLPAVEPLLLGNLVVIDPFLMADSGVMPRALPVNSLSMLRHYRIEQQQYCPERTQVDVPVRKDTQSETRLVAKPVLISSSGVEVGKDYQPYVYAKSNPDVCEKKVQVDNGVVIKPSSFMQKLKKARRELYKVTEYEDALDCLLDSVVDENNKPLIPYRERHPKGHKLTIQAKTALLWRYRDKIDGASAIKNLTYNEIEDNVIGRLHGLKQKNRFGRTTIQPNFNI